MQRNLFGILVGLYLVLMVYFAFRPFCLVASTPAGSMPAKGGNNLLHVRPGTAQEVEHATVSGMRRELLAAKRMSLEIVLKTDSLKQAGPARILTYSRDNRFRNFTLAQEGDALSFRLRTTRTDYNALLSNLVVPKALVSTNNWRHVVVTYDGEKIRMYLDGVLQPTLLSLGGGFDNWGRNHVLVIGDEPNGGKAWSGSVQRIAVYDRVLDAGEVAALQRSERVGGSSLLKDFQTPGDGAGCTILQYRNLFISRDSAQSPFSDRFFNVAGFIPLGALLGVWMTKRFTGRKVFTTILVPVMIGFLVSGCIEWMQRHIVGRVPSTLDVICNVAGTLIGCLLGWLVLARTETLCLEEKSR